MKSYDRWRTEGDDIKCTTCGYVYTQADGGCDPCELRKEEKEMNSVDLDIMLSAKIRVNIEGEESLNGFDVNQDVVSMLAEDFNRWLTATTGTWLTTDAGLQAVTIETLPTTVNVSDVTGEDDDNVW